MLASEYNGESNRRARADGSEWDAFPKRRGSFHKRKMHRVFQVSMKIIEKEGRCIVPARSAKWNTVHTVRSEFFYGNSRHFITEP